MLKVIEMTVNGEKRQIAVDDRESLLDTLRNLGFTSVKKGCEVGECGACTVLVNGEAVDSCIYLTMWAAGKSVMTVEGLKGPNGELSPIQRAFIEEAAVQCGFCTPGMVMAAKALLDKNPDPTEEEIKEAMKGNLCRCTGYVKILEAVKRAAQVMRKEGR